MRDDADQPVAVGETGEQLERVAQRVFVQRAEALVDEHRFQPHAAAFRLHHVRQSQRQRQRGHERLAAGERGHVAPLSGGAVEHVQIESGLAAPVARFLLQAQDEHAVRQKRKPLVRRRHDLLEIVLLHVGFERDLHLLRQLPADGAV